MKCIKIGACHIFARCFYTEPKTKMDIDLNSNDEGRKNVARRLSIKM